MMTFSESPIHDIALGVAFIVGSALFALAVHTAVRWVATPRVTADTKDLAGSVLFRVGALHGLILALIFSQEMGQYRDLRLDLQREASYVANIYYDIDRYDTAVADTVRNALAAYVAEVVEREWAQLAQGAGLSEDAWQYREVAYLALLDLTPETPRQISLRQSMLAAIREIASLRDSREGASANTLTTMFWVASLAGFALVVVPYFIYSPTGLHRLLIATFAGYTGLVLLFILAFSQPFTTPGRLEPTPFVELLESEIGVRAQAAR